MPTVTQPPTPPQTDISDLLKRDIGLHRAAQTLADAMRCRDGLRPVPLRNVEPRDREWYRQTARNLIEIFETVTTEREPDGAREQREMQAVTEVREQGNRLAEARARASAAAGQRGHQLGPWHCPGTELGQGRERAQCQTCGRTVFIDIFTAPLYSGMAVVAGCLVAADQR